MRAERAELTAEKETLPKQMCGPSIECRYTPGVLYNE